MDTEPIRTVDVEIQSLEDSDISSLEEILRQHIRDGVTGEVLDEEIEEIKSYMRGGTDGYGRKRIYLVAKDTSGNALGCIAYSNPDADMLKHFNTTPEESAEALNFFVAREAQGQGIGRKLFDAMCQGVRKGGKRQVVVNSGPRYKATWAIHDKMFGQRAGFLIGKYGEDGDAMTWVKGLE